MDPGKKEEEIKSPETITTTTMNEKCCADCKTTKTPLWRSGPTGPKSLCNACGIRQRKKRAATVTAMVTATSTSTSTSISTKDGEKKSSKVGENSGRSKKRAKVRNSKCDKLSGKWRQRLMAFGEGVGLFQKQRSQLKKKRQRIDGKLGEVEQAAVLLMSLSYGSVLA